MSEGTVAATAPSLAAELAVADLLADGPRSYEDLARSTSTHAPSLHRTLQLLSSVGVFTKTQPGWFGLTALADCLRSGKRQLTCPSITSWLRRRCWLRRGKRDAGSGLLLVLAKPDHSPLPSSSQVHGPWAVQGGTGDFP